jgi:antitoxin HicB
LALVIELPGLMMTGDTPAEAIADLESVKREWIETYLKLGNKMPEPLHYRHYSGKVILRMPPSLHEKLVQAAELEGISFNQYMVFALSMAAGREEVLIKERKASYKK